MSDKQIKNKSKAAPLTAEEKAAKKLQKKFDRVDKKFSWLTVVKIVVPLVVIAIIVFVLIKAAFGNSKNIKFDTSSFSKSDASPVDTSKGINGQLLSDSGMTIFADNGKLRLGYSPRDDLFIIQDLSSGRVFRSYPEPLHSDPGAVFQKHRDRADHHFPRVYRIHEIRYGRRIHQRHKSDDAADEDRLFHQGRRPARI